MFEYLTETDKRKFMRYTEANCWCKINDNAGPRADVSTILAEWDKQKSIFLSHIFKNKLILSKNISYEKPRSQIRDDLYTLVSTSPFWKKWCLWRNHMLDQYDSHGVESTPIETFFCFLSDWEQLVENKWFGSTTTLRIQLKGEELQVAYHCKMMRLINKVYHLFKKEIGATEAEWQSFQTQHSIITNDKKIMGEFCLSIHPLDYVTASDNDCDWRSCMNWCNDGEYHRGTVEMMNAPYIVCAYINAKNPMFLIGDDEWTNKKWREFFIVTPYAIAPIKGYPYCNEEIERIFMDWLRDLCAAEGTEFYPIDKYQIGAEFCIGGNTYTICWGSYDGAMYDDLYDETDYPIYLAKNAPEHMTLRLNGYATCMWCGEVVEYSGDFTNTSSTVCIKCEHACYCSRCGERMSVHETYEINGELVCNYCYCNDGYFDYMSNSYQWVENATQIWICNDEMTLVGDSCMLIYKPEQYQEFSQMTAGLWHRSWGSVKNIYVIPKSAVSQWSDHLLNQLLGFSSRDSFERYYNFSNANNFDGYLETA